jgi:VCBS repeat-containing protein
VPGSVFDNDYDPDAGDVLTASKVSGLLNASGTLTFNASDGTFNYQNDPANLAGSDLFFYEACDPYHVCTPGMVSITISSGPMDNAPTPIDDAIVVAPLGSTSVLVGGASSVLANDTDPDPGQTATLTAHLVESPANGHVTLNADGTFAYGNDDPAPGVDSFTYEACDTPHHACVIATVSVTIDGAAPTVTCQLPRQVNQVGDTVNLDLSLLFAPPPGASLDYGATNLPPSLSIVGSLLTGTLTAADVPPAPPYVYASTLEATAIPGASASEDVIFQVLPAGELVFRDGFDTGSPASPCP